MNVRRISTFSLSFVLMSTVPVSAQERELGIREIQQALVSPDSLVRHETWKRLNPEDPKQYKILLQILKRLNWFDREGAVYALAQAGADEETVEKMVKALKSDRDPYVRQGMAVALAKMKDERFYHNLYEALGDKHPFVRRVVVHSLRIHKERDAVEALVQRFQEEEDPVVRSFLESSLNDLTQAYRGPNPAAWLAWWEEAKADPDFKLGKTDEEAVREAEELGRKLKERTTVTAGVTLTSLERGAGEGVPILIIPFYGYSKRTMLPFLSELEKNHKLHYLDLPPIQSFKGSLQHAGQTNIPYYPIDLLVEAFEKLRQDTGEESFAIMACGMNSWIAMRYAAKYPRSVRAMILVAPISSQEAYGKATERFQNIGKSKNDIEMWHFGLTRQFDSKTGENLHDKYHREHDLAKPEGEPASLDRRSWSLYFKDEQDSIIGVLYPVKDQPLGSVAIPDFRTFAETKLRIPTIVFVGKASLYTSVSDAQGIAKHFGGLCRVFSNSSCMVFAEESERFNKEVAFFLKKFVRKKAK